MNHFFELFFAWLQYDRILILAILIDWDLFMTYMLGCCLFLSVCKHFVYLKHLYIFASLPPQSINQKRILFFMNLTKLLVHTELVLLELVFMWFFYTYSTGNILRMNLLESNKFVYLLIAICPTDSESLLKLYVSLFLLFLKS